MKKYAVIFFTLVFLSSNLEGDDALSGHGAAPGVNPSVYGQSTQSANNHPESQVSVGSFPRYDRGYAGNDYNSRILFLNALGNTKVKR